MRTVLEFSHCEYRTVIVDAAGLQSVLPVIVTDQGILDQFVLYMHLNRRRSRSWQDSATFSLRLLVEYAAVNHEHYDEPKTLFKAFSDALFTGTIGNYRDPSGLWWEQRHRNDANTIISHITRFTDWLAIVNEESKLQLNPWRDATNHEQRLNWAAYSHRRHNAFLSHLWQGKQNTQKSRQIRSQALPVERTTPAKAFPDDYLEALVREGFRRRARDTFTRTDLRNTLITYLMHYGGLRLSEALSLWSEDVTVESGEVVIRVYHPEYGKAPDGSKRSTFLEKRYGLKSRNTLVKAKDPLFLGWKNGLITDPHRVCFEVFFYPYEAAQTFALLWRDYHLKQRVKPRSGNVHPYAFTNKEGQPYSHRMFRKAHKLAVERIGLEYEKLYGTTPHGHRHAYGQRLAKAGATPIQIKSALHHASIASSETYTQPTAMDIRDGLRELEAGLSLKYSNTSEINEVGQ